MDKALQALVGALHGSPWQLLRRFSREFRQREDDLARAIGVRGPEYLEEPKQFSMAWTNHWNVYQEAKDKNLDDKWASSLTDVEEANSQFWPMIAEHGMAYNLLILQKVDAANKSRWERMFPHGWPTVFEEAFAAGNLYVIDLSLFENVKPHHVDGADRFTPSTTTWLVQHPDTKALTPVAIRVSGYANQGNKFYQPSDPAWLYALQAAKTSITVYGIWIGHVYHYHVVTAAMQMTMYNTLPADHAIYQLLAPQSKYVIPFDDILLLLWRPIGPPTSISTPVQFLRLADLFAGGRSFFDDDPKTTLSNCGIRKEDFTANQAWDQYPIVGRFLEIWDATEKYVSVFVDETYADDQRVAGDPALRSWMQASASRRKGNILRSAADGRQNGSEESSHEHSLSHHRTRRCPFEPRAQSCRDIHVQLSAVSAKENDPRSRHGDQYAGFAGISAQHRHARQDGQLLLHLRLLPSLRAFSPRGGQR